VKVIAGEECVSQHQLLVGDVIIDGAPRKRKRMHTPRLKIWKLRVSNVKPEFAQVEQRAKMRYLKLTTWKVNGMH